MKSWGWNEGPVVEFRLTWGEYQSVAEGAA